MRVCQFRHPPRGESGSVATHRPKRPSGAGHTAVRTFGRVAGSMPWATLRGSRGRFRTTDQDRDVANDRQPGNQIDRAVDVMGVLQGFEDRLEGAVEGFFARVFRSGLQPIELAKGVQRYAADNQHVTAEGVVVPNVYRVRLSAKDHERLSTFGASLPRELGEVVATTASERGWVLKGPVKVRIEQNDAVRVGRFQLAGRIEVVDRDNAVPAPSSRLQGGSRGGAAAGRGTIATSAPAHDQGAGNHAGQPSGNNHRAEIDHTQVISGPPTSSLQLLVRTGEGAGNRVGLNGSRLSVGRLGSCDIPLPDSTVSREHAALVRRSDTWWVVDLGSTNGTRVNGVQAAEHPITVGDRIEFGDAAVELVES